MTTTLRYTGSRPLAFSDQRIGWQEPGGEFGVPNDEAEAYVRRGDLVVVAVEPDETDTAPDAPQSASEPPADAPAAEDTPAGAEPATQAAEPVDEAEPAEAAE